MNLEKLKETILEKSLELFVSMGVKIVTMDDIAEELAISKKTIYTVFSKKEDIVREVFHNVVKDMNIEVEDILSKKQNPITEIRELHDIYTHYLAEMKSPNILQTKKYYNDIYMDIDKNIWEILRDSLSHAIKRGIQDNMFKINVLDDDKYILLYYYSLRTILMDIKINRKSLKNILSTHLFHFCRGISSSKGFSIIDSEEKRLNF